MSLDDLPLEARTHAGLSAAQCPKTDSVNRHRYENHEPAALRGEAAAGAVLRHGLHRASDVKCDRIRQESKLRVSCCPQGRGDNKEWQAVNWR